MEQKLLSFHHPRAGLAAELSCSLRGRFHGAHGGGSDAPLLQGVKPVDGGSTRGADLGPQLRRVFPGVAEQLPSSLQHTALK